MTKVNTLFIVVVALLAGTLAGCKKDSSSTLSGNLFGFASLYDQYGVRVLTANDSTAVALTTPAQVVLNTKTDSTGKFNYTNLAEGQYIIGFSKAGYGSLSNSSFGFLGGGNIDHDVKLSALPNFYDSLITVTADTLNNIVLTGTFSGTDTRKRTYVVFVGNIPNVNSLPANYKTYYSGTAGSNLNTFTLKIPISDLNDAGFTSGSTVYFAIYGAATAFATTSETEDYNTGRLQFNALSTTLSAANITLQ